ncbi:hypothetical protein NECAME_10185 [Necator americanus]|uniref:Uncharacterized protein n=1 Tax=Necator americanus TaxID=51031 RepID=W2TC41_NECAM|nr:hypothetical protein NECAME_10185 [Necator americanus]ETN78746.1 hypothetical protein NECAME_10185 [Necator americanus]
MFNNRKELKTDIKPLAVKRRPSELTPTSKPPTHPQTEGGYVIYIPRALTPEQVKVVRLAFFKILTDQYDEERDLPMLRQLQTSDSETYTTWVQLSVRGKNKKEVVESLWKRFTQSADEVLLSGQRDVDDFFEHERNYLVEYNTHIKDAASKAEKVVKLRKTALLAEFDGSAVHGARNLP